MDWSFLPARVQSTVAATPLAPRPVRRRCRGIQQALEVENQQLRSGLELALSALSQLGMDALEDEQYRIELITALHFQLHRSQWPMPVYLGAHEGLLDTLVDFVPEAIGA